MSIFKVKIQSGKKFEMANKLVTFILISVYFLNRINCAEELNKLDEILNEVNVNFLNFSKFNLKY